MNNNMMGGMAGQDEIVTMGYDFETQPGGNDNSYELDGTNRDLITQDMAAVPVDMRSPDVSVMKMEDDHQKGGDALSLATAEIQLLKQKQVDESVSQDAFD